MMMMSDPIKKKKPKGNKMVDAECRVYSQKRYDTLTSAVGFVKVRLPKGFRG